MDFLSLRVFLTWGFFVTGIGAYSYIGCFLDAKDDIRVWPWATGQKIRKKDTIEECTEYCRGFRKRFAGVEFGGECFCGDTYPNQGSSMECHKNCTGNPSQICGGPNAMSVYFVCTNGTYIGANSGCYNKCGRCKDGDVCHHINGSCPNGCQEGDFILRWPTDLCTNPICSAGYYVHTASNTCMRCGHCINGENCRWNGYCQNGCQDNYKPNFCQECEDGFYQEDSTCKPCGHCLNDLSCNSKTGECLKCKDLWEAPKCLNCQYNVYKNQHSGSCREGCGHCAMEPCSQEDGSCSKAEGCVVGWQGSLCKDCADGFYGDDCQKCGNCLETRCNKTAGHCTDAGCIAGFMGDRCTQWCSPGTFGLKCALSCSVHCKGDGSCAGSSGECNDGCNDGWKGKKCDSECESGTYGQGCSKTCSNPNNCKDGDACHHVNGSCPNGCKPGFKGDRCLQECEDGTYGSSCTDPCGKNCKNDDVCNRVTGECPEGCKDGWTGTHCNSRCLGKFYGPGCKTPCGKCAGDGKCHHDTGQCERGCGIGYTLLNCTSECNAGFYGQDCIAACGKCSSPDTCKHIHGNCPKDCKPGWTGEKCDKVCHEGSFGQDCKEVCGNCESICNPVNGVCEPEGCQSGFVGQMCKKECEQGLYGKNCSKLCKCETKENLCHHVNGSCPVVSEAGPSEGTPGSAIGGGLGAIFLIAIIVIVIIVILKLRKRTRKGDSAYVNNNSREFGSFDHENNYAQVNDVYQEDETAIITPAPVTATPCVLPPIKTPRTCSGVSGKHQNSNQNKPPTPAKPKVIQKPTLPVKPMVQTPGPSSNTDESGVYENKDLRLKISEVGPYIKKQKQEEKGFENEYLSLPGGQTASWAVATNPVNSKTRNRYRNIYAYDHSRVPLKTTQNGSDYINANFINGYKAKHKFIATQGPKNTCDDLWTMIWEQNVTMVVMVTNIKEGDKNKSDKYWPDVEDEMTFGDITITNTEEQEMPGFTIRTLCLKKEKDASKTIYGNIEESERKVLQFHFTEWPDKDVPKHGTTILNFVRKIKTESTGLKNPIVVHCSAGVGRTGTFIAIDHLLDQAKAEKMIDVYTCVKEMRENRIKMVQTMEQYVFIYDTMYEAVMVGDTSIQCFEFGQVYSSMKRVDRGTGISRLEEQYKMLKTIAAEEIQERNIEAAISEENIHKNRSKKVLPANSHRMYLTTTVPGRNYYINSVFSKSYNKNHGVVLTQLPLLDTIVDFWRMVYDYNIDSIVMLTSYQEKESKMVSYWPFETETVEAGPFTIRQKDMKRTGAMICCHLVVEYKKESREVYLTGTVDWPDTKWEPKHRSTFYELFSTIQTWQQKQKKAGKIAIQCLDGGMKSGMYAVVSWMFDMINAEQAVDIFQITKQVVTARPEFLVEQEQYEEFYKIAEDYMKNFQTYSNFQ